MKEVWQVKWNDHMLYKPSCEEMSELAEDILSSGVLFSSREKAEGYVEKYFNKIAKKLLNYLIDGEEDEWNDREAKKVQWDNVSQEFIDKHERWGMDLRATSYWIEPEHAFDHYGFTIASLSCMSIRE